MGASIRGRWRYWAAGKSSTVVNVKLPRIGGSYRTAPELIGDTVTSYRSRRRFVSNSMIVCVWPGALHTNPNDLTATYQPPKRRFEPRMVRWERLDTNNPTVGIDRCCHMLIGMGIHTTNNHPYHRHDRPLLSPKAEGAVHAHGTAERTQPSRAIASTGDPPAGEGVQHQPE